MISLVLLVSAPVHTYHDLGPIISYPTEIRQAQLTSGYIGNISAYSASDEECGKSDGITASGTHAKQERTIAAPSWIPFGTKVIIGGHEYIVEDRGGYICDNRLDIYMDSREEAVEFGRKELEVTVEW